MSGQIFNMRCVCRKYLIIMFHLNQAEHEGKPPGKKKRKKKVAYRRHITILQVSHDAFGTNIIIVVCVLGYCSLLTWLFSGLL